MGNPPYSVTWLSNTTNNFVSLTQNVISLPIYSDTGSGEVNSAVLVISGPDGKFLTDGNPIQVLDLINITDVSPTGKTYNRNFQIIRIIPSESKPTGVRIELHCLGLEWNLQVRNISLFNFMGDGFTVSKAIQDIYNDNKKITQARIAGLDDPTKNTIPNWTAAQYNFTTEGKAYDRLIEVLDRQANPPEDGGVFDYFEMGTFQDSSLVNLVTMKIVSSGKNDSGVIISGNQSVNIGETEGGIDAPKGTVISAWGEENSGTLLMGWAKFQGGQLTYDTFPQWNSTVKYVGDSLVFWQGSLWKYTGPPNTSGLQPDLNLLDWQPITRAQWFGNKYVYSEFTNGKVADWINSGCNILGTLHGANRGGLSPDISNGFFDHNMIIDDGKTTRTWVNIAVTDPANIPNSYKYLHQSGNTNDFYVGMRVLCFDPVTKNGTGTGVFAGTDVNGVSYSNAIIEYQGSTAEGGPGGPNGWVVLIPNVGNVYTNLRCAVLHDGLVYIFNGRLTDGTILYTNNQWQDMTQNPQNSNIISDLLNGANIFTDNNVLDCFHPYIAIEQEDIDPIDPTFLINKKSGIKVTYGWQTADNLVPNRAAWYRRGCWISFSVPFPPNVTAQLPNFLVDPLVGFLYGNNSVIKGPSLLDSQNMTRTPQGLRGFCQGEESEQLGTISAIAVRMKMMASYVGPVNNDTITINGSPVSVTLAGEANFKIGAAIYDIEDNVMVAQSVCQFNNNSEDVLFQLSQFTPYRGVTPLLTSIIDLFIPPKSVSPVNPFRWDKIKHICIFTAESYDDQGRYNPIFSRFGAPFKNPLTGVPVETLVPGVQHYLQMVIDGYRFVKPLLANSGFNDDAFNLEPPFTHHEDIITYQQLKAIVSEEYQRFKFIHKEYDLTTTLEFDIDAFDSFYYRNPRIVTDADNGANTIKLVAKRIEYSRTKPANGQGGALRRIIGVKRFGQSA